MVNKNELPSSVSALVQVYAAVAVATVAALLVVSAVKPAQAPQEAWVHAVIVVVFAVVLGLRARGARHGSSQAARAVGIIAAVLLVANLVEALVPVFPGWMSLEMVAIALLMAAVVVLSRGNGHRRPARAE